MIPLGAALFHRQDFGVQILRWIIAEGDLVVNTEKYVFWGGNHVFLYSRTTHPFFRKEESLLRLDPEKDCRIQFPKSLLYYFF